MADSIQGQVCDFGSMAKNGLWNKTKFVKDLHQYPFIPSKVIAFYSKLMFLVLKQVYY
jgi:hypothetical protein